MQPTLLDNIPKVVSKLEGVNEEFNKIDFENTTMVDEDDESSYLLNPETFEDTIQNVETRQQLMESRKTKCSDSYVLTLVKSRVRNTNISHANIVSYKWKCHKFRAVPMDTLDL